MPSTTIVVASVFVLAAVVVLLIVRARKTAEPKTPRFEPPRELAKRPPREPAKEAKESAPPPVTAAPSVPPAAPLSPPTPALGSVPFPPPAPVAEASFPEPAPLPLPGGDELEATSIDALPPSTEAILADQILVTSTGAPAVETETPAAPPPLQPKPSRPPMRSYSNISDASVAAEARAPEPEPPPQPTVASAPPFPPVSERKVPAKVVPSEPKLAPSQKISAQRPPLSEPKLAPPRTASEPKLGAVRAEPKAPPSEPKTAGARPLPKSEPVVAPAKPAPVATKSPADEHDFSALNDAPKAPPTSAVAATVAKYAPAPNPATADLEKNDPRHAAARRLARLSVSEIKLYHEDEVKAGREAKDLWKRLQQDISLARQTFEARVVAEVRERFDYLLDEIIRQLAEGDPSKLGADAPQLKSGADAAPPVSVATAPPPAPSFDTAGEDEAPTRTARRTIEPEEPKAEAKVEPPKPSVEAPASKPIAEAKPAEAIKPTGLAARALPVNPETAELEKNDPRHAAARRLARLSVSEIKLYHEDEVKAGREAKDLWKRLTADISLATQTFEKRVDKEVRDRFDYLYDEILRQLAEGDVTKLGPDAPRSKKLPEAAPPAPAADAEPKPVEPEPKPAAKPVDLEPKPAAKPVDLEPKPAAAAPSPVGRYMPPSNPATAELEKNDPRHAAARRLARLSVSEIKLYHEDEVKAGREAKDLWKRLTTDIGLATQTFEKRVDKEVRDRFDYLYDEILRQLAEGDITKLGAEAPKPKIDA